MICLIDYGMGNLNSVEKALRKVQLPFFTSSDPNDLSQATHLILPGVGFFEQGIKNLQNSGFISALRQELFEKKKPLLGICLGMQLLFESSEEGGECVPGLGFIRGKIVHFKISQPNLKVPHVGWNDVFYKEKISLFEGIEDRSNFYFVHSYHAILEENASIALTNYDYDFVSAVQKENIFGTQFHPEKSQKKGLKLLENFAKVTM